MHSYIDIKTLKDFSKKKSLDDVIDDIEKKFSITNITDDDGESLVNISEALYCDYVLQMANYESYIEPNMDARLLMELRKSACLNWAPEYYDFYEGHKNLDTAKEVDKFRTAYIQKLNPEYTGLNWQYWSIIRRIWGKKVYLFMLNMKVVLQMATGDWSLL